MNRVRLLVIGAFCAAVFVGSLIAAQGSSNSPARGEASRSAALDGPWREGRSAALLAILDEHFEWWLREEPLSATARGDRRYDDRLGDESPQATQRRLSDLRDRLVRLETIMESPGAAAWVEADRLDADLLRYELTSAVDAAPLHEEQSPVNLRSGPQVWLPQMADQMAFNSDDDYASYAARLEAVPRLIEQNIEQMREGLKAGRVPPRVVVRGTDEQAALLATADIEQTPSLSRFYKPFLGRPADDVHAARARRAIASGIVPAYRALAEFLREEYIPNCRDSFGIADGVDGPAAYQRALRLHTTTDMTADEVHALGLAEVARIRGEMLIVIGRTDWPERTQHAPDERLSRFFLYLRSDPRFYCQSAEELLAGYRDIAKKVDPALPRLFATLPRTPYGVREMASFQAPTSPTAYYHHGSLEQGVPGFFVANTYRLDQRPKYEMVALTLHEACPGHHLQVAIAKELTGVHPFRTMSGYTAFVEGWGLYAERLGLEMAGDGSGERVAPSADGGTGLYTDPYDDFGRLTYEMWRSCRLVVDTGIHAKGWSRTQAIDFMTANTALSSLNIEREVDRYISWPGQACAYKIGQIRISALRARAEQRLGTRFDIRRFHEAVLGAGAIPLPALEARIERWIASCEVN